MRGRRSPPAAPLSPRATVAPQLWLGNAPTPSSAMLSGPGGHGPPGIESCASAPVAAGHHCLAFDRHGYRPGAPRTQPRSRDSMRGGQVALRDAREVTGRSEQVTSTWCPHTDSTTGRDKLVVGHRESHAVYAGGGLSLPSTPGELAYPPPILLVHLPWVATPSPRHSRQRRLSGRPRTGLITAASLLRRHQRAGRGPQWWPTRLAAVLTGE
jgi:hypothetical protein